jgi:hypothetical protein
MRRVEPVDLGILCEICYMSYVEEDMYGLHCNHKFCLNDICDYLEYNITNGQVIKIKCPQASCPLEFTRDEIRSLGS